MDGWPAEDRHRFAELFTRFVAAFAPDQRTVSLAEFARLAALAAARAGTRIVGLLAMDGGPSAHLWFPGAGQLFGARGDVYLPSAVCLVPR